ncbi:ABC transporter permease [Pseudostreptobacillus hongkongensis]|uniref:ABC transporter permease n=1 Tax=Pseudostreptobacillus hongkongensis TaxID=1162717 RepID=UPI00082FB405|nr:ABC transporter permease [Pseudostreptobacillus hongkongensis]
MEALKTLLIQTITVAPPVLITAVGACLSELSGVTNIGLEGIMLSGAFAAAVVNYFTGNPYLAILSGMVVGLLISLIHAVISIHLKGDQIISGVAINLFAVATTSYLIKTIFKVSGSTPAASVHPNKTLVVLFIYVLALLTYYVVYHTVLGLRIRAVGEHPLAADTVGISVYKYRYIGVLASGVFGGLGGAYMTTVILASFTNNMSAGRGFMAMAAMIFGRWNPLGAILASLLFAFGQALSDYTKASGGSIPQEFLAMIPYLLTIVALVAFGRKSRAPKASGKPYEK